MTGPKGDPGEKGAQGERSRAGQGPILRTVAGSPAARAGLRGVDLGSGTLGDVIVGANDKPVRRMSDLTDQLEMLGVDHTISLSIEWGGRTTNIGVPIDDIGQAQ
jgi:2-alkenal reductase